MKKPNFIFEKKNISATLIRVIISWNGPGLPETEVDQTRKEAYNPWMRLKESI